MTILSTHRARLLIAALALACFGAASPAATAQDGPAPPAAKFFGSPAFFGAVLAPDGRALAINIAGPNGHSQLAVLDLQTMKPTVVASFGDAGIGNVQWVNDTRLVFDLANEREARADIRVSRGLFAVNADGSAFRQLVETTRSLTKDGAAERLLPWNTFLLGSRGRQDGDEVFVVVPEELSDKVVDHVKLKRLNTRTGRIAEVGAPLHSREWVFDADGALRLVLTVQDDEVTVQLHAPDGSWSTISKRASLSSEGFTPRFVAPDGSLLVEAYAGRDKLALYRYDPVARALAPEPVLASDTYDLNPTFIADDKALLGYRFTTDAEVTQWTAPRMQQVQAAVDTLLPATANRIDVAPRAQTPYVLVTAFADVQPPVYYLYDTAAGKLRRVGAARPDIDAAQMSPMEMLHFPARDGLAIPAYLTLPRSAAVKKNLPMVVFVHGGPWVRGASWQWQPEVQFLASRGHAVLQPEFRGSTGFGQRHFQAGWKQWGLAMQDDLADAAKWAIAQGIADPKRICIAGASYGGYATLMGLVNDPGLFRCGFEWVGVTDLDLMYSVYWSDISDAAKRYGLTRLMGDRTQDAAQFKATSPLANAGRITQPLLMAYGGADTRVPIVHGEKLRDALRATNPQVEWVEYGNEGHGWARLDTQVDFWGRVERFLARNIGAAP